MNLPVIGNACVGRTLNDDLTIDATRILSLVGTNLLLQHQLEIHSKYVACPVVGMEFGK